MLIALYFSEFAYRNAYKKFTYFFFLVLHTTFYLNLLPMVCITCLSGFHSFDQYLTIGDTGAFQHLPVSMFSRALLSSHPPALIRFDHLCYFLF